MSYKQRTVLIKFNHKHDRHAMEKLYSEQNANQKVNTRNLDSKWKIISNCLFFCVSSSTHFFSQFYNALTILMHKSPLTIAHFWIRFILVFQNGEIFVQLENLHRITHA